MRSPLQILLDAVRRLSGTGALHNAADEMEQWERRCTDLDAQLDHLLDLPRRPAA